MPSSPFHLGPGPGSQILQALASHWGVGIQAAPRPAPAGILLPAWWQVLLHGSGFPPNSPWMDRWARLDEAGTWAPNALTLMTHTHGGRVVVDLDPNDDGTQATLWLFENQARLLACNLEDLAALLEGGPEGLEKLRLHEPVAAAPTEPPHDALPIDPLTLQWQSGWAAGMRVFSLERPGQGVTLGRDWTRHPCRLLFAGPG